MEGRSARHDETPLQHNWGVKPLQELNHGQDSFGPVRRGMARVSSPRPVGPSHLARLPARRCAARHVAEPALQRRASAVVGVGLGRPRGRDDASCPRPPLSSMWSVFLFEQAVLQHACPTMYALWATEVGAQRSRSARLAWGWADECRCSGVDGTRQDHYVALRRAPSALAAAPSGRRLYTLVTHATVSTGTLAVYGRLSPKPFAG